MTNKEILTKIAENDTLEAEIRAWANERIVALDASHAKAAERRAAKKESEADLRAAVFAQLSNEPKTSTDVQTAIADTYEVSVQKVTSILRGFVADGSVVQVEVKGEKGKRKAYTLA